MSDPAVFTSSVPSSVGPVVRIFAGVTLGPIVGSIAGLSTSRVFDSSTAGWAVGLIATAGFIAVLLGVGRRDTQVKVTVNDEAVVVERHGKPAERMELQAIAQLQRHGASVISLTSVDALTLFVPTAEPGEVADEIFRRIAARPDAATINERINTKAATNIKLQSTPAVATITIAVLMGTGFALELATGALSNGDALARLGAAARSLVFAGDVNRLVVANFLHGSFAHIVMNLSSMVTLGSQSERVDGWSRMVPIVFVSAVTGMISAVFFTDGLVIGMSTALYGLLGAAAVTTYKYRNDRLDGIWLSRRQWVQLVVINGLINLIPGVSFSGHFGGFAGGVLMGLVMLRGPRTPALVSDRVAKVLSYLAIVLTVASFVATFIG